MEVVVKNQSYLPLAHLETGQLSSPVIQDLGLAEVDKYFLLVIQLLMEEVTQSLIEVAVEDYSEHLPSMHPVSRQLCFLQKQLFRLLMQLGVPLSLLFSTLEGEVLRE